MKTKLTESEIQSRIDSGLRMRDEKLKKKIDEKSRKVDELKSLLGVDSLIDVRFYLIGNMSAVVVRKGGHTICALSFYNPNDGSDVDMGNISTLGSIGYTKFYNRCLHAAMNFKEGKYLIDFPYNEKGEFAVYKNFMALKKSGRLHRNYRNKSLQPLFAFV